MKAIHRSTLLIVPLLLFVACAPAGMSPRSASHLDRIVDRGVLRVGTAADMPPLTMLNRSGEAMGLDADLAAEMARAMGVTLHLLVKPRSELLPALAAGEMDVVISGLAITPRLNLRAALVGPYALAGQVLLSRFDAMVATENIDRLDAPAFAFVAREDSPAARIVKKRLPHARLVTVPNDDETLAMVLNGTVDAMVADTPVCVMALLRHPDAGLVLQRTPLSAAPLGIALPAGDAQMINWTANFLDTLRESDTLTDLRQKWFEDPSWLPDLK
jgi:polar amino acid transport system substrate-binding protein